MSTTALHCMALYQTRSGTHPRKGNPLHSTQNSNQPLRFKHAALQHSVDRADIQQRRNPNHQIYDPHRHVCAYSIMRIIASRRARIHSNTTPHHTFSLSLLFPSLHPSLHPLSNDWKRPSSQFMAKKPRLYATARHGKHARWRREGAVPVAYSMMILYIVPVLWFIIIISCHRHFASLEGRY